MSTRARILVIDDSETAREIYGSFLRNAGYEVLEAPDGPMGLDLARTERPHLLLVDVVLPGMDGLEIVRRIRQTADLSSMPIICVTAARNAAFEREALALGCAAFVEKPDSARHIVNVVADVLGPRGAAAGGAGGGE